jgi:hypothetical protein
MAIRKTAGNFHKGPLAPHSAHAFAQAYPRPSFCRRFFRRASRHGPHLPFEKLRQVVRNEARTRGIDETIPARVLATHKKALRDDQVKGILRALVMATWSSRRSSSSSAVVPAPRSRRHTAVDDIEGIDRFPFLALGGVDRRKDQVVLVAEGWSRTVAGSIRRVESEFGQKALSRDG